LVEKALRLESVKADNSPLFGLRRGADIPRGASTADDDAIGSKNAVGAGNLGRRAAAISRIPV
jgi:hypothetical protein